MTLVVVSLLRLSSRLWKRMPKLFGTSQKWPFSCSQLSLEPQVIWWWPVCPTIGWSWPHQWPQHGQKLPCQGWQTDFLSCSCLNRCCSCMSVWQKAHHCSQNWALHLHRKSLWTAAILGHHWVHCFLPHQGEIEKLAPADRFWRHQWSNLLLWNDGWELKENNGKTEKDHCTHPRICMLCQMWCRPVRPNRVKVEPSSKRGGPQCRCTWVFCALQLVENWWGTAWSIENRCCTGQLLAARCVAEAAVANAVINAQHSTASRRTMQWVAVPWRSRVTIALQRK